MAKSPSPFAGMKLTEQTPLAQSGVDQKLFSQPTPLPEKAMPHEGQENAAAPKPRLPASVKPKSQKPVESAPPKGEGFDLNTLPYKNHTFSFTTEELEAMEDLKTDLRRRLDLRVTKIDIIRSALHTILADYRQRGDASFIVERIKTKKPR
jgi:hypothetical protein